MLEQNFEADQNQDNAADQLGLGFVARAEEIADLETDCGEQERRNADERDGQRNVDVGQQGKRDADGQRVDARGQRQNKHGLDAERSVAVGLLLGQALLDHARADGSQQDEGDPVVKGCDVLLERRAEEISDGWHERLKAAEPCADDQIVPGLKLLHGEPLTDRYGERVHGKSDAQKQDLQNTHNSYTAFTEKFCYYCTEALRSQEKSAVFRAFLLMRWFYASAFSGMPCDRR